MAEPTVDVNDVSRISAGTVLTGDIVSQKDIRIDGTVNGKVNADGKVVIGEKAFIKGSIVCSVLDVWGKIEGEVFVKDTLSVKSSADISGTLNVKKVQVELGSQINGDCRMISDDEYDKASGK